jgi:drug/metabolite transporter (DMT)-like permease
VAAPQLGPNVSAGLRMLLATAVLAAIMRALKHSWPLQHWRELLLIGFLAVAGPHLLYSWSALHLPGGYGALLSVTAVLFGAFASALLKEETLTRGKLAGCVLGLLGAGLVVKLGPVEPTATLVLSALVCMGAAALSGTATPFLKRATLRMEPLSITAGMHAAAMLMLLPGALYDLPQARFTWSAVAAVVVLGVATSGLEMTQNSMRLGWSREEVDQRLHRIMVDIHRNCRTTAEAYGAPGNYVMGANIAGFVKVADAMIDQGLV